MKLEDLAQNLLNLETQKEVLKQEETILNGKIESVEIQILESLENSGIEGFKFGGYTFFPVHGFKAKVLDFLSLKEYLIDNDKASLLKESVHHKTLDAMINELLKEGLPVPECVSVTEHKYLGKRKEV